MPTNGCTRSTVPQLLRRAISRAACVALLALGTPVAWTESPRPSRVGLLLETPASLADRHADWDRHWHECLEGAPEGSSLSLGRPAELRELLFPLLEAGAAPSGDAGWQALLTREPVRRRLLEARFLHVLLLDAEVARESPSGPFMCGGATGPGCLGVMSAAEHTRARAWLWDVAAGRVVDETRGEAQGRNVAIGVLVPILVRADTARNVCAVIAQHLASALQAGRR